MALRLFHRTSAETAEAILKSGFKDGTGSYLTAQEYSGVWLSDVPLDPNEGAFGDILLEVMLNVPEQELEQFEWKEEGKGYREWLVPALLINSKAVVRIVAEE